MKPMSLTVRRYTPCVMSQHYQAGAEHTGLRAKRANELRQALTNWCVVKGKTHSRSVYLFSVYNLNGPGVTTQLFSSSVPILPCNPYKQNPAKLNFALQRSYMTMLSLERW